jgi:hypothetical protein
MAVNLTIVLADGMTGTIPGPNGMVREDVKITGSTSVAGDTGTYTTQMKTPNRFEGAGVGYSFSGQVMTLTDKAGLGSGVISGSIFGYV